MPIQFGAFTSAQKQQFAAAKENRRDISNDYLRERMKAERQLFSDVLTTHLAQFDAADNARIAQLPAMTDAFSEAVVNVVNETIGNASSGRNVDDVKKQVYARQLDALVARLDEAPIQIAKAVTDVIAEGYQILSGQLLRWPRQ